MSVDSDLTTVAVVLVGGAAAAAILALLGIRFNQVKVAGTEFGYESYEEETKGLARAAPADAGVPPIAERSQEGMPVEVDTQEGPPNSPNSVPVPVTRLTRPMRNVDHAYLHNYILARTESQHSYFLTHILAPATQPGQKYSIAVRVTPHENPTSRVTSATFYLGRAWGDRVFKGRPGPDGRFGIATEAFGPFLALCEVQFDDGSRILLDHYCDFDMGTLLPS